MLFREDLIGRYVFSKDPTRPEALTAWKILDKFEVCGEYLLIQNVETGERKCCFTFYDLKWWDAADPINYPLEEVLAGIAEIQDLNDVLAYKKELPEGEEGYGWLSPTGEFFHCHCGDHILIGRIVLGMSELMLEARGWVKVLYDDFLFYRYLTPEQARWLKQHGINEEDVDDVTGGN